jgi:DnaK suppressor protein
MGAPSARNSRRYETVTSTQLERLRSALETRLKELGTLLRQRSIAVERAPDPMDEVVLAGLRELAISSLDNSFAQLHLVKAALCRLGDGSYGYCVRCEGEIGMKRLTALPQAFFCIRCQELMERQGESLDRDEDSHRSWA